MTDTKDKPAGATDLGADLDAEAAVLQRELGEVEMLLGQVRTEAQRHEARRQQTAERFDLLLSTAKAGADLREAHEQLMLQSRRASLMEAQLEVLEGKQKVLRRFADHLAKTRDDVVTSGRDAAERGSADGASRSVLEAQEEMRRQIARQMHDGPAQSIANIALQAEVVQRLLRQDAAAGERELDALRDMVEHALDETKAFIFDVRPMVLDDLGLMPTLRRSAQDRARRTGRRIRFESLGADRRLGPEHESALFRIVDDAVTGYLEGAPEDVLIQLSWTDEEVTATVASETAPARVKAAPEPGKPAAKKDAAQLPPALAAMIDDQRGRADRSSQPIAPQVLAAIRSRASASGIEVSVSDDGRSLSAISRSGGVKTPLAAGRA